MEYLAELLKEKKQLAMFPGFFPHVDRLLDAEIARARSSIFQCDFHCDSLNLPAPEGEKIQVSEKVFVPIKEHPEYNFVGRILGPRGMTAKQLEQETGCKIMIRGEGSMRDRAKEELCRGKPNYEHLGEKLHVLIQCEDTKKRASMKMENAVEQIKKLLTPPVAHGIDELKRKQLMELAIINGTYRPSTAKVGMISTPRLNPVNIVSSPNSAALRNLMSPIDLPPPSLFGSPLPSPVDSGSSSSPSLPHINLPHSGGKYTNPPPTKHSFDSFDMGLVMKALNQQTFESATPCRRANNKSPWSGNNLASRPRW